MYSEYGTPTQELQDALDRVNNISTDTMDISKAQININLNGTPFLAPKMSIYLDGSFELNDVEPVSQKTKTSPTQSDIEAKKADIERRREEDLKKFGSTGWSDDLKQPFLEKFGVEVNGWMSSTTETWGNTNNPNNDRFTVFDLIQIINAKYDAELRALEGSSTTQKTKTASEKQTEPTKKKLLLKPNSFILDSIIYAYFRDVNGDIYTTPNSTEDVGKRMKDRLNDPPFATYSYKGEMITKAEFFDKVRQTWTKQPANYFDNFEVEVVAPDVGTSSRTKQGKKNKDKEC